MTTIDTVLRDALVRSADVTEATTRASAPLLTLLTLALDTTKQSDNAETAHGGKVLRAFMDLREALAADARKPLPPSPRTRAALARNETVDGRPIDGGA